MREIEVVAIFWQCDYRTDHLLCFMLSMYFHKVKHLEARVGRPRIGLPTRRLHFGGDDTKLVSIFSNKAKLVACDWAGAVMQKLP